MKKGSRPLMAKKEAPVIRRCLRCNRVLEFLEVSICSRCTDEMWREKRRRNLFIHFFFQLGMLIFTYLYFYKGAYVIYLYLRG